MENEKKEEIDTYDDIYIKLKECFDIAFGNEKEPGLISMIEVRNLVDNRKKIDSKNKMPENSLMEIPRNTKDIYKALENTYISRDYLRDYSSEGETISIPIGCAEIPEEQLDGITNMTLLMYLSNHLSKEYEHKYSHLLGRYETSKEKEEIEKVLKLYQKKRKNLLEPKEYEKKYNDLVDKYGTSIKEIIEVLALWQKKKNDLLDLKNKAITDIIASTYVLEKTSDEYENYFSYGSRMDNENKTTFVMDLPYIGQLCVHFGWEENKYWIVQNAQDTVKSILEKKLELGQITEEKQQEIIADLEQKGVLPEYEGKLYEFVGAMPIEYIGENTKKYRKMIGDKLPEQITSEDIEILKSKGLNERELYYFFIKMGASKKLLNEISGVSKKVTPQTIEKDTDDTTIEEFDEATKDLKDLALEKGQEKTNPNIRT